MTALGETVLVWDRSIDALAWGPTAAAVLGLPPASLFTTGRAFEGAIEPENGRTRAEALDASSETDGGAGVPYRLRYGLRTRIDRLVMVEEIGRWFADAGGRPALAHAVLRVTKAVDDGGAATLGLRGRADLLARIMDDVREAQRSRHAMTLVVGEVDPDQVDDGAISQIERRIRPILRRRDSFSAYAPSRFALALPSCPASEAEAAVARICNLVEAGSARPLLPGLRLGAASAPDHAVDAPELLRRAEEALARVRSSDGSSFSIWSVNDPASAYEVCGTDSGLILDALNDRRLVLALHPAMEARTRMPAFHEARLHLRTADGHSVPVGDLGHAAMRAGFATLTDARLLELTANHLAAFEDERILVEFAPATLADPDLLTLLAAHLGARPGIESRLVIGVPEPVLQTMPSVRGRLDAMKALGVGIALTGFGAGHASCRHLRILPLDLIRLDGALIQVLPRSADDRLLVRSLVELAHHFGIPTVADWIDDQETAGLLAGWGVDYLQGPLWSPAIPTTGSAGAGSMQAKHASKASVA
jgi:EAL domain-containing protein (putative c-di-GMP-specific phosphodiesterase class I)/GGDEF domain-containing protein